MSWTKILLYKSYPAGHRLVNDFIKIKRKNIVVRGWSRFSPSNSLLAEKELQRDIDIWNAFRSGDKGAFATIYELHFDALYSYGKRFITDETRVEDAIQDLFINLWRSHANVSPVDNIKFYLFRSLRRDIYRITEKEKIFPKVELDAFLREYEHPGEEHIIHDDEKELTQKLVAVLQSLSKRQLEAITLRYYENFSISEIAEIMDVSDKTVRNTLHNSLTLLRKNSRLFYTVFKLALAFIWH